MTSGRRLLVAFAALAELAGVVWLLQGVGVIPGSFMTGRAEWAVIGGALALATPIAVSLALRR